MKDLTVKQLAVISGVTVRTLHHYDEIGLLKPASVGANGYRYYSRAEMLRLQQILFHRELGVPLNEIADLLEMEASDQIGVLARHREKLIAERQRFQQLIETIDRTVATLKGEDAMTNSDLYKGFSADKQAEYEAWLLERFDNRMRDAKEKVTKTMREGIQRSREAHERRTEEEKTAASAELKSVEEALAEGLKRGIAPDADALAPLVARHKAWVSLMWDKPCTEAAYRGLADLYLSHPDFVKRYETIEPGFANYLTTAMKAHAAKG